MKYFLPIAVALACLLSTGCSKQPAELVVGDWVSVDGKGDSVTFNSDGTVLFLNSTGGGYRGAYSFMSDKVLEIKWTPPIEKDNSPSIQMTAQHIRVTSSELETNDPATDRGRVYKRKG